MTRFKGWKTSGNKYGNTVIKKHGIVFDSMEEVKMWEGLTYHDIEFEFQPVFYLTGPTMPKNKKVPLLADSGAYKVKLTADFTFVIDEMTYIIDIKGSPAIVTTDAKLRYNLLKHQLYHANELNTRILFLYKCYKEVDKFLNAIWVNKTNESPILWAQSK